MQKLGDATGIGTITDDDLPPVEKPEMTLTETAGVAELNPGGVIGFDGAAGEPFIGEFQRRVRDLLRHRWNG